MPTNRFLIFLKKTNQNSDVSFDISLQATAPAMGKKVDCRPEQRDDNVFVQHPRTGRKEDTKNASS